MIKIFKYIAKLKEFYREYLFTQPHLPFYSGLEQTLKMIISLRFTKLYFPNVVLSAVNYKKQCPFIGYLVIPKYSPQQEGQSRCLILSLNISFPKNEFMPQQPLKEISEFLFCFFRVVL